jgi:hypothetical protein
MPWVWTDEIVEAIGDGPGVDRSMMQTLRGAPVAIQASSDETMEAIARRIGVLNEAVDEVGAEATG